MLRVPICNLLKYSTEQLWDKLNGDFILVMDDGEIPTNEKEVLYSSYFWDFHRKYPNTPALLKHHVKSVIGTGRIGSKTHLTLVGNCLYTVYDTYKFSVSDRVQLLDDLAKFSYERINHLYNELTYRLEEYVTSIDILDFVDVTTHPKLVQGVKEMEPTQDGIDAVYKVITDLIMNDPAFLNNPLAKAAKSGIVDVKQVLQCVGPRGFLTDIDSHIFEKPILRGFVQGLRSLTDAMQESRSAAKALAYSTDPLQQSEYFSRRQQLICQNVKHLHMGDCGSEHYLLWNVRGPRYEGKQKVAEGDLKTIQGKYYLDETTGSLKIIKASDEHLIGKTIKIRSVVAGCMHPDPYGICEVCFGESALSVPANTNIGHMSCVSVTEKISQNVLSTKHHDGSSVVEGIVLKPFEKKYLTAPVNGSLYFLNEDMKHKAVMLMFDTSCAMGLADVNLVDNVEKLNIARVSEFESVEFMIKDKKGVESVTLDLAVNKRNANMTHFLLKHIKTHGWTTTKEGKYVIDMEHWDYSLPIFSLPMKHFSMGDHQSCRTFYKS